MTNEKKGEGTVAEATGKVLHFRNTKETKNTYVFSELTGEGAIAEPTQWVIGSVYVQKSFFGGKAAAGLKLTLEAE